jgi:hypothetical protein
MKRVDESRIEELLGYADAADHLLDSITFWPPVLKP